MSRKVSPKKEGSTKNTLKNFTVLADVSKDQGRLREAEELFRAAIAGKAKVLGRDHPETLNSLHSLALVLEARRNFEEALSVFQDALVSKERILGRTNASTCVTAFCLGDLYRKLNRYKEARLMFEYALEGYIHSYGEDHKYTRLVVDRMKKLEKERACCLIT